MILSRKDIATVKRVAGIVYPIIEKKDKLLKKVDDLNAQIKECDDDIERFESGIKKILGYGVVDLIDKVKVGNQYKYVVKQSVQEVEEQDKPFTLTPEPAEDPNIQIENEKEIGEGISEESMNEQNENIF